MPRRRQKLKVRVECLPVMSEEKLRQLHKEIVARVVSVSAFGVSSEQDMIVLFPKDAMEYGLGDEITVEISNLRPGIPRGDRETLSDLIVGTLKMLFPNSFVDCSVRTPHPLDIYCCSEDL